jgi:hypothetical protein
MHLIERKPSFFLLVLKIQRGLHRITIKSSFGLGYLLRHPSGQTKRTLNQKESLYVNPRPTSVDLWLVQQTILVMSHQPFLLAAAFVCETAAVFLRYSIIAWLTNNQ